MTSIIHQLVIDEAHHKLRLDQAIALLLPDYSRTQLTEWIKAGGVKIDDIIVTKPRTKVLNGQIIDICGEITNDLNWHAEPGPELNIVHEAIDYLVINKPANMVVHPGAGNSSGTLINFLLERYPELTNVTRCGLIHRLDKDTTGLLVVARTPKGHQQLSQQLLARDMKRTYITLCKGHFISGGTIDKPIGRHNKSRTKMAIQPTGRHAITHYRILDRFLAHTLVEVELETGRTHQIRVHFEYLHHPIVGDQIYGKQQALTKGTPMPIKKALQQFERQALHACKLCFTDPHTNELVSFEAPIPMDMQSLIDVMHTHRHD